MFVTDRTIFLQLQKTGSMHICKLLAILVGGYERDRHCRLPADLDVGIGSVEQFSDSTDILSNPEWRAGIRNLYCVESIE